MSKKGTKKTTDQTTGQSQVVVANPSNPPAVQQPVDLSPVFDSASLELQEERHKTIDTLFDKAAMVLDSYLDDPGTDSAAKMFPAKLVIDIYHTQEKLKREDERIEIEKRKLAIEEKKSGISNPTVFNQQNNYILPSSPQDLAELKKRQEEILASFRNKPNNNP